MQAGPHLVYFADPMCSWCWGFSPVVAAIGERFGDALPIRLVLGGLRPWTMKPMDDRAKASTRSHWEHVHEASGQPFDFAFFDRPVFVYDTEPACRAVVVMRRRDMVTALAGLHRIHAAFYAENRDVTDAATLTEIAANLGFDPTGFRAEFDATRHARRPVRISRWRRTREWAASRRCWRAMALGTTHWSRRASSRRSASCRRWNAGSRKARRGSKLSRSARIRGSPGSRC